MNNFYKNLGIWIIIGLVFFILFNLVNSSPKDSSQISFTEFMSKVRSQEFGIRLAIPRSAGYFLPPGSRALNMEKILPWPSNRL